MAETKGSMAQADNHDHGRQYLSLIGRERERVQQEHTSNAIAGGVAGALSKTCTAPLGRLTILLQVQGMATTVNNNLLQEAAPHRPPPPSITREAYRIVSEEGCLAFWKGNLVTILHRIPYSAINFYAYQRYKDILMLQYPGRHNTVISTTNFAEMSMNLMAGAGAGITAASLAYPLDLLRTRLSVQTTEAYYRGIFHALRTISRDEGVAGLYKGLGPTLLNVGPSIAINFCVYGTLRSAWEARSRKRVDASTANAEANVVVAAASTTTSVPWASLAFGSTAGIVSTTLTFPLDVVRKRRQMEGAATGIGRGSSCSGNACDKRTAGVLGTLKSIAQREGLRGLFRGMAPEYMKVIPSTAIMFTTFEFVKGQLQK